MEMQTCVQAVSGQNCRAAKIACNGTSSCLFSKLLPYLLVPEPESLMGSPSSSCFLFPGYLNAPNWVLCPLSPGLHYLGADFLDNVNHSIVIINAVSDQGDDLVGNGTCHQA